MSKEIAPAFQFYAQDFLTGVMYLTNEEIGIYIKMLAKQWTDEKIPKKRLRFLVGLDWDKFSEELKSKFIDKGEYIVNKRLEEERDKQKRRAESARKNGKKGGRPPKSETQLKPTDNPIKSFSNEDEDENEVEDVVESKKPRQLKKPSTSQTKKSSVPSFEAFHNHAHEKAVSLGIELDDVTLRSKYEAWKENGWKTLGKPERKIKNWKSTVTNNLQYWKKDENQKNGKTNEAAWSEIYKTEEWKNA